MDRHSFMLFFPNERDFVLLARQRTRILGGYLI